MNQVFPPALQRLAIPGVLLLALTGGGVWAYQTFFPKPLELTGLVQATEMKDASELGGRVVAVYVQEGDTVKQGQPLLAFSQRDMDARLSQAQATFNQAQAEYDLIRKGATSADLAQASATVSQANTEVRLLRKEDAVSLSQAQAQLSQATAKLEDAQQALDQGPQLLQEGIISTQKLEQLQQTHQLAREAQRNAQLRVSQLQHNTSRSPETVSIAQDKLKSAKAFYQKVAQGARPEEEAIAKAAVDKAKSQLKALQNQRDEVTVKAKITGTVTLLNARPGDLILPGQPVVLIVDDQHLWTDVYVPEAKLYDVQVGQAVEARPTTHPNMVFPGEVALVNVKSEFVPTNTAVNANEGPAFRVKVRLDGQAAQDNNNKANAKKRLYPGMKVTLRFQPRKAS